MKKAFSPRPSKQNSKEANTFSFLVSPWFVIALVVICFAILTPKIFLPMFMSFFGLNSPAEPKTQNFADPRMRGKGMPHPHGDPRGTPQFGRPGPGYGQPQAQPSQGKSSLLTFLLPVYAIGIGVYMVYTLFKVFKKDDSKEDNDSDFDEIEKRNYKFKEKVYNMDKINAEVSKFKAGKSKSKQTMARSEESEDELDEYARYNSVDPEYLEYIKEIRRQKKLGNKKKSPIEENEENGDSNEIALTPGSGLTSITNTNVLMNDTLERMKHSLNKINNQLVQVENKGSPLQDPELDSLKLQLTQTELQMSKIMTIVNNVSATLEKQNQANEDENDEEEDDDDYEINLEQNNQMFEKLSKNALRNRRRKAKKQQMQYSGPDEGSLSSNTISSQEYLYQSNDLYNQYPSSDEEFDELEHQRILQKRLQQQLKLQMKRQQQSVDDLNNQSKKSSSNKQSPKQINVNVNTTSKEPLLTKSQQKNLKKKQRKKAKANSEL